MPRLEWIAKTLADRWDHLFRQREDADPYHVRVVVTPAEYFDRLRAPFELRYAIDHTPNGFEVVRSLLREGKGIAILRAPRTPRDAREAAERLSKTQSSIVDPWLARLIFHEQIPVIDTASLDEARRTGIDPYADARRILARRKGMIRFALVDLEGKGIVSLDTDRANLLNHAVEPLSASYLYHRLNEDWPKKTIRFISLAIRVMILATILRALLPWSLALAFVVAALGDDLARFTGRLLSLRYAGYTRKQVKKEALPYLVPFAVALCWVFVAISMYDREHMLASGFFFGLSAVSFPLFESVRVYIKTRGIYRALEREGKLSDESRRSPTEYVLYELRRNQSEWGLMLGAIVAPVFSGVIFALLAGISISIWMLAIASVLDVLFAIAWRYSMILTDRYRFMAGILGREMKGER